MVNINWQPSPSELRRWGIAILAGTALSGFFFYFFIDNTIAANVLWIFGTLSFVASITGTKVALPFYFLWMAFVWIISHTLGILALAAVFFLVVTPIGILARMLGRDRLKLCHPQPSATSFWEKSLPMRKDRIDRPF
jgi:hypothetical protein